MPVKRARKTAKRAPAKKAAKRTTAKRTVKRATATQVEPSKDPPSRPVSRPDPSSGPAWRPIPPHPGGHQVFRDSCVAGEECTLL